MTIRLPLGALLMALFAGAVAAADQPPSGSAAHSALPRISVKGNHFVDPSGQTVLFRGVSIVDPDVLVKRNEWNRELFVAVKSMGADLIRIPVHPAAWRSRTPAGYLELLDQAVAWCGELGIHVDIDWHSIGNLKTGLFQDPIYNTSYTETLEFWRTISRHFKGNSTVAFYELFNEPTTFNGMLGRITWPEWKDMNEEMIGIVRYWDRDVVPLVAGFDWAYDLTPLHGDPINAEGIGYVSHPYPNKRSRPWEPKWEEDFGFAADKYPVIATEIGFGLKPGETVDDDHYGNRITRYLEGRGISWLAWVYDDDWQPAMLKSYDGFELNGSGRFFKVAMNRPPVPAQPPVVR